MRDVECGAGRILRRRGRGGRKDGYTSPGTVEHHPLGRLARTGDPFLDSLAAAAWPDYEGLIVAEDGAPLALLTASHPSDSGHVAVFPEQLIDPLVRVSSEPGDVVLDPFLGSGTTAIVAQRHGRRWLGCELTDRHVEIATRRIQAKGAQVPLVIQGGSRTTPSDPPRITNQLALVPEREK